MWAWLSENSGAVNALLNFFMLIVWALYFQLLLNAQHRQRLSKILINRSAGHTLSAHCLVSNMSSEPVYLEAVVMEFETKDGRCRSSLTDLETLSPEPEGDVRQQWFQGPLMNGEYVNLGTFDYLLSKAKEDGKDEEIPRDYNSFDFIVIATYGPDHEPVVARRGFRREEDGKMWHAGATEQVRSKARRREFASYVREAE